MTGEREKDGEKCKGKRAKKVQWRGRKTEKER